MPQVDAGFIVQVDVEDDAKRFFEIVVISKGLGRREQDTFVTVFTQQPLYSPERSGVIIDDKDDISIPQDRYPVRRALNVHSRDDLQPASVRRS